ncbi:MAG TPA: hypothetical protein VK944_04390, partial [Candidatus Limnocylindria bacterium]|nr:hypothetical protein [Candidatus Limnocylindria bacterium]
AIDLRYIKQCSSPLPKAIYEYCRAIIRTIDSDIALDRFGCPENPAHDTKQEVFLFRSYYQTARPNQVETDAGKPFPLPARPLH